MPNVLRLPMIDGSEMQEHFLHRVITTKCCQSPITRFHEISTCNLTVIVNSLLTQVCNHIFHHPPCMQGPCNYLTKYTVIGKWESSADPLRWLCHAMYVQLTCPTSLGQCEVPYHLAASNFEMEITPSICLSHAAYRHCWINVACHKTCATLGVRLEVSVTWLHVPVQVSWNDSGISCSTRN